LQLIGDISIIRLARFGPTSDLLRACRAVPVGFSVCGHPFRSRHTGTPRQGVVRGRLGRSPCEHVRVVADALNTVTAPPHRSGTHLHPRPTHRATPFSHRGDRTRPVLLADLHVRRRAWRTQIALHSPICCLLFFHTDHPTPTLFTPLCPLCFLVCWCSGRG